MLIRHPSSSPLAAVLLSASLLACAPSVSHTSATDGAGGYGGSAPVTGAGGHGAGAGGAGTTFPGTTSSTSSSSATTSWTTSSSSSTSGTTTSTTSSSSTTTTGAGGAGNGPACEQCAQAGCAQAIVACENDPTCGPFGACAAGCAQSPDLFACADGCAVKYPGGGAARQDLFACVCHQCPACAGLTACGPTGPSCVQCATNHCAQAIADCVNDAACGPFGSCASACGKAVDVIGCANDCLLQHPNGGPKQQALLACVCGGCVDCVGITVCGGK